MHNIFSFFPAYFTRANIIITSPLNFAEFTCYVKYLHAAVNYFTLYSILFAAVVNVHLFCLLQRSQVFYIL